MALDLETERRVLGTLPAWRSPKIADAWRIHEQEAGGGRSIEHYTLDELAALLDQDPDHLVRPVPSDDEVEERATAIAGPLDVLDEDEAGVMRAAARKRLLAATPTDRDHLVQVLEDLQAVGLASVNKAGEWKQTKAGLHELTGDVDRLQAKVAMSLGVEL